MLVPMETVSHEQAYQQMRTMLNEKQWGQYLALEAKQRGSISQVAREAGVSLNTVKRGLKELEVGESYQPGERIRKVGGGKKKLVETDATLLADLEQELEPKGDPMSLLRWTCKSLDQLVKALQAKGHHIKKSALAELLHAQGFSLRANKKTIEGKSHADRDGQFAHIHGTCQEFEQKGAPIISVDCKKKELLGNFKNNGREWQGKGEQTNVNVYDFLSLAVLSTWASIMIPLSLLSRVSGDGGAVVANSFIRGKRSCSLLLMGGAPTERETDCGRSSSKR